MLRFKLCKLYWNIAYKDLIYFYLPATQTDFVKDFVFLIILCSFVPLKKTLQYHTNWLLWSVPWALMVVLSSLSDI